MFDLGAQLKYLVDLRVDQAISAFTACAVLKEINIKAERPNGA